MTCKGPGLSISPLAYVWILTCPSQKACYPFGDGRLFFRYWQIEAVPVLYRLFEFVHNIRAKSKSLIKSILQKLPSPPLQASMSQHNFAQKRKLFPA